MNNSGGVIAVNKNGFSYNNVRMADNPINAPWLCNINGLVRKTGFFIKFKDASDCIKIVPRGSWEWSNHEVKKFHEFMWFIFKNKLGRETSYAYNVLCEGAGYRYGGQTPAIHIIDFEEAYSSFLKKYV